MMQHTAGLESRAFVRPFIIRLIEFLTFCQDYFVTRPDVKHLGNTNVIRFTIRRQRRSAGINDSWGVLEGVASMLI